MPSIGAHSNSDEIKRVGTPINFTQHQAEEYIKCKTDFMYFIKNYVKIVDVDRGLVQFSPYEYQEELLDKIHNHRFNIAMMCRQSGKTTTVVSYILYYTLFNSDKNVTICAHKEKMAEKILEKVQTAYKHIPKWMQQGVVRISKSELKMENRSTVTASPTSKDGPRGTSNNLLILDEFAFVQESEAEAFWSSVYPTISASSKSKVVIISTPNGMNKFYRLWKDSERGINNFVRTLITYERVPKYDKVWIKDNKSMMEPSEWAREFECSFSGSTPNLVNIEILESMEMRSAISISDGLYIWEMPKENHRYLITVDPSNFIIRDKNIRDYSAFMVFDVTTLPYKVVVKYMSKNISASDFPSLLYKVGKQYWFAAILTECSNNYGIGLTLHDMDYPNMLMCRMANNSRTVGQELGMNFSSARSTFGVVMSAKVKQEGCIKIKDIIENRQLVFWDDEIVKQFVTFIPKKNSWGAQAGSHDDLISCLIVFAWIVDQDFFKEYTELDLDQIAAKANEENIDNMLRPVGFVDLGTTCDYFEDDGFVWNTVKDFDDNNNWFLQGF